MLLTEQAARLQGGDWAPFFAAECAKPYFAALDAFVTEAAAHTTVYPAAENIFAAFAACPAAGIRAVILGQDPYHEPGQAMGLSFSVPDACKAPPSLRNIFKELESETGTQRAHNDLTPWAPAGRAAAEHRADGGAGPRLCPRQAGLGDFHQGRAGIRRAAERCPPGRCAVGQARQKVRAGVCRRTGPPPRAGAGIGPPQPAFSVPWVLWVGTLW